MKYIVTREEMKTAEANAVNIGINALKLMENAGVECYRRISEILDGVENKTFVILCGGGNNGGDGIVLAYHIKNSGGETLCVFPDELPKTPEAAECYDKYISNGSIPSTSYFKHELNVKQALQNCDVIIDAVFGTGFDGQVVNGADLVFSFANTKCQALKISVDLPSGVNGDSGAIAENAFRPDITLSLGGIKKGTLAHPAFDFCGNIVLLDIGIPAPCYSQFTACLIESDIMSYIPHRAKSANKGNFGKLLNIAGSERYMGAALLSSKAAYKCGTGLVTLAASRDICGTVSAAVPETTFLPLFTDENGFIDDEALNIIAGNLNDYTAVLFGCGLGVTKHTRKIADYVIKKISCPIILDADGINSLVGNINVLKDNDKPKILTPHPLEFSRLSGIPVAEIQADRIRHASDFALKWNVTVVLKGTNTVIASPDGRIAVNTTGNAGLAKAGSGDVLGGIIGGFAAQGLPCFEAAVLGAYLHGLAADRLAETVALPGIMPNDVADILPFVMKI